jgi:hypothetical protein
LDDWREELRSSTVLGLGVKNPVQGFSQGPAQPAVTCPPRATVSPTKERMLPACESSEWNLPLWHLGRQACHLVAAREITLGLDNMEQRAAAETS